MIQEFLASRGLGIFPTIGMMIFLVTFVGVLVHHLLRSGRAYDAVARLPLEDDGCSGSVQTEERSGSSR